VHKKDSKRLVSLLCIFTLIPRCEVTHSKGYGK